ncbi:MAG: hypothetical protein AB3N64_12160 [Puniceicoccaceae bacterium]
MLLTLLSFTNYVDLRRNTKLRILALFGVITLLTASIKADYTFEIFQLPGLGDRQSSSFWGISGTGDVLAGYIQESSSFTALRLEDDSRIDLGDLQGGAGNSIPTDISQDGSIIVGYSFLEFDSFLAGAEAFRWEDGMMTGLGALPGGDGRSAARAVSTDGAVIVGASASGDSGDLEAFRWEEGTMTGLGFLPDDNSSDVRDVSGDGTIIIGSSGTAGDFASYVGVKWVNGIISQLPAPDGAANDSVYYPEAISADGSVIIGNQVYWENDTAKFLDLPEGIEGAFASEVSADGSVIVGFRDSTIIIWNRSSGVYTPTLVEEPIDVSAYGELRSQPRFQVRAMSPDGSIIVGDYFIHPVGGRFTTINFIARKNETTNLWGGFEIFNGLGDVDTANWIGWININQAPYIWSYSLGGWIYMDEPSSAGSGAWGYFLR